MDNFSSDLISGQEAHPSYATQVGYYLQQSQPRIPTTQQINPAQTVSLKLEMKDKKVIVYILRVELVPSTS